MSNTETAIVSNRWSTLTAYLSEAQERAFLSCRLHSGNGHLALLPPTFAMNDGDVSDPIFALEPAGLICVSGPRSVFGEVSETVATYHYGEVMPSLRLEVIIRSVPCSPVFRFRYRFTSDTPLRMACPEGQQTLNYFAVCEIDQHPDRFTPGVKEVRFSEFNSLFHSFMLAETEITPADFAVHRSLMGPMIVFADSPVPAGLVAYEHGSQAPDRFLAFDLYENIVGLKAEKGNYYDGQIIGSDAPFLSPWFQIAAVDGDEAELAKEYRTWVLKYQTPNAASRKPYIFYNTWNYQERVRHWTKRPYLAEMNEARMLAEIEVAHRMGIDVFVIDTGWYEKTGDWRVSTERFPNGLAPLKAKLDEYGMKLGLWFNPTVAALSSDMRRRHEDCLMTHNGQPHKPHPVWETEASQGLSLVSRYWEAFADELIRLHREVGVTYFKWDAIGQYGSDAANHYHGTEANTAQERRDGYGFLLGRYMTRVVDRLCAACPEAIVDFDITEGGRTVGLEFLSAGKYFLINNGPYSHDYNMPVPTDGNVNLFFFPGPARAWICRAPLSYDKWLPSVLFLTHYLPDDRYREVWGTGREIEAENQWIAIASLVLGQNGVWGDLCALSEEGINRFGQALSRYKQVRDEITAASPVRQGMVGGSPEIHEKIDAETGRGVVSFFATSRGTYDYVTANQVAGNCWHNPGVTVTPTADGRAHIAATFGPGQCAKVIFFGVEGFDTGR